MEDTNTNSTNRTEVTADDRKPDAIEVVRVVREALDIMERRIARSREMLGEVEAWVASGRVSPLAPRYLMLRESENAADQSRLDHEFFEVPVLGVEITTALGWSVGLDLNADAESVLESMIEETDVNGNNEYRYLTSAIANDNRVSTRQVRS